MSVLPFRGTGEGQEFVASLFVVAEGAEHGAGYGLAVLLFDAAHLHAEVAGFDDHAYALGSDFFLDGLRDLTGETLLDLQAAGEHVDQSRDLTEPDDALFRQVGDVGFAEKWKQVVFAEAEELDVLDDNHFVVGHAEGGAVQHVVHVLVIAAGQELQGFFIALGGSCAGLRGWDLRRRA